MNISNKNGVKIEKLSQWDRNVLLYIQPEKDNYDLVSYPPTVRFSNIKCKESIPMESMVKDGKIIVSVPNILLQNSLAIKIFVYFFDGKNGQTIETESLQVINQLKPSDYVFEDNVEVISLREIIQQVEISEAGRANAEDERVAAENIRKESETNRIGAESERTTAEAERISAENNRVEAEKIRTSAETNRVKNENARVQAESERTTAETERTTAENNRLKAENERLKAENERLKAEGIRVTNENARLKAENARISSENARAKAESERAKAEILRVEAENVRIKAETEREKKMRNVVYVEPSGNDIIVEIPDL